ncbi:FAD-binding oxidoreductase [Halobaculum gomorrense]|uniref:FAD/FMN-containing dehydrogenase n=1 Tax=Halobaculum gomorrense TaxID=43928 RepID=A0A1M5PDV4_9EURY|nr:FAD-binding oxidoreductase [Halobaculum gomorrense]SHG99951.1 FAD/FMN-containing dehydrogenase [Halobaculum gomorrense]
MTDPTEVPDFAASLAERTRGTVLEPGSPDYESARTIWNARIDREPAAILSCRGVADVVAGVNAAREHGLDLSVKGGGHHVSGSALTDGGLTLDLGAMDGIRVDPEARTARVGPGATWGDVDHETTAFDLAVPGGQDPNIGVAGLTLGGGVGWLSRKHGLTSDNLRSVDLVTADGELVRASATENPELFWALRGGGGAFGVVTSFEFDLHEIGEVFAGSLVHRLEDAPALLRRYASFTADAPPEVRLLFGVMELPASPTFPEHAHGTRVAILIAFHAGPPAEGREVLAPLRTFGDPLADTLQGRAYETFQRAGDSGGAKRTHLRSQYLDALPEPAIETAVEYATDVPDGEATLFVSPRGGAETAPPPDETAYPHRDAAHHLLLEARWEDPAADAAHVEWVETGYEALAPYTTGAAAANFLTADEGDTRRRAAYGGNYDRLAAVKRRWDPEGLFSTVAFPD